MILAQDLRLAVLQYAIEGKLSERKATDTSTKTTLVELKAKKESLIKEKKLKHQYKDIVNDDFPFEIPNTWEWVKLNDIGELSRGKSKHRPRNDDILYTNGTVPLIQTGDIASADKYISQYNVCYNNKGVAQSRLWKKGTLCITIAANIGDVAILGFDACFPDSVLGFLPFSNKINIEYIYFMLVAYKNRMNNKASKVAQSNLSLNKINSMYFPFPPLEEQERIVERVNAIMAQIDEYEKIEQELVQLKANFPGDMRAAILQAAMQGKLTEQLESDSSVEEMIKQKICNSNSFIPVDEEEHPFDIPTNWQWVRLGNFVSFVGGTSYKRTDTTDKGVRILRGGNIQESKILYYEDDVFLPNKFKDEGKTIKNGDILIVASTGSKTVIGKPGFVYFDDKDTQIGAFLRIIRIKDEFADMLPYIRVIFRSEFYRNHIRDNVHGVNINNVRSEHITMFAIPIPPIEEQQRIVERLDELLPLCDNLM